MEKQKIIKQLTFTSIMLSINIVFIILNLYLPLFSLIILIGLPFASSLVKLNCNYKYTLGYLLSSFLIGFFIDYQTTIFYLIPSLISGIVFGILIKKNVHGFYILFISSLSNIILEILSIIFLKFIYNIDFLNVISTLLNINISKLNDIFLSSLFLLSYIQMLLSYIIIEAEISKFNFKIKEDLNIFYPTFILDIIFIIISLSCYNYLYISYLFTTLSLIFSVYLLYYVIKYDNKILNIISLFMFIIIYIICLVFSSWFKIHGLSLYFNIFSIITLLISVIFILYIHFIKKEKINQTIFNKLDVTSKE